MEGFHDSVDLLDVTVVRPTDDVKKILRKPSHFGTKYRQ